MTVASKRVPAQPGLKLRELRIEKGLTLNDLSERTGLPASSVSKMENGKTEITFGKLVKFSEALGVDITALLGSQSHANNPPIPQVEGAMRRSIYRAGEGEAVETPRGNYLYLVTEVLHKRFAPIIGDVLHKDISTYGEYSQHDGEEFVYVLSGTLELHTEMYTPAVLEEGDSMFFDSAMRHAYIAKGDVPCRIMSICTTPDLFLPKAGADAPVKKAGPEA